MSINNKMEMYLFYGSSNPLSNWHPKGFWVKVIWFHHVEQFMMYCKAKLLNDEETATLIMSTNDPAEAKRLGRKVKNFDKAIWDDKAEGYVYIGALAKFRQNPSAGAFLMSLSNRELVEASPTDVIWGVGLAANDAKIYDRTKWRGENRLGRLLERVRDTLIEEHERNSKMFITDKEIEHLKIIETDSKIQSIIGFWCEYHCLINSGTGVTGQRAKLLTMRYGSKGDDGPFFVDLAIETTVPEVFVRLNNLEVITMSAERIDGTLSPLILGKADEVDEIISMINDPARFSTEPHLRLVPKPITEEGI